MMFCFTKTMSTGRTFSTAGRNGSENQSNEGIRLLTPEEENAFAVLADAVDRSREEDMRTPEVLASLDLLARSTSLR